MHGKDFDGERIIVEAASKGKEKKIHSTQRRIS
jgi:hypothetical protein